VAKYIASKGAELFLGKGEERKGEVLAFYMSSLAESDEKEFKAAQGEEVSGQSVA